MRSIRPGEGEKTVDYAASRSPLPRAIEPQEVADATAYLCSPLASAVTGHTLYRGLRVQRDGGVSRSL